MKTGRRTIDDYRVLLLPPEITTEILSRLPADSAIGCRGICKQWRSLIDHPSFRDTHTRQVISSTSNPKKFGNNHLLLPNSSSGFFFCAKQKFTSLLLQLIEYNDDDDDDDDDEERLVTKFKLSKPISDHPFSLHYKNCGNLMISSCNGLVFMGPNKPKYINQVFVCNPFTREYVNLQPFNTIDDDDENYKRWHWRGWGGMTYGFGYLPCTNEYKIVSIYHDDSLKFGKGNVSVYTLGSGKWRNKGEIPYNLLSNYYQPGILANGAIHWYTNGDDDKKIVSFDLADEEFRVVVPLPSPSPSPSPNYINQLGVLGGCLCVTRRDEIECKEIPKDVWILNVNNKKEEEEEEVEFSWNRKFSIPWKNEFTSQAEPYVVLRSGKILLRGRFGITSYDPKTEAFYRDGSVLPNSAPNGNGLYKITPYTKSFVSLKALGEEDAKCFGRPVCLSLSNS